MLSPKSVFPYLSSANVESRYYIVTNLLGNKHYADPTYHPDADKIEWTWRESRKKRLAFEWEIAFDYFLKMRKRVNSRAVRHPTPDFWIEDADTGEVVMGTFL